MPQFENGVTRQIEYLQSLEDKLMSYAEVGKMIGKSVVTLRRYKMNGEGPRAIVIGRYVRFKRSDVLAWIEAHAEG